MYAENLVKHELPWLYTSLFGLCSEAVPNRYRGPSRCGGRKRQRCYSPFARLCSRPLSFVIVSAFRLLVETYVMPHSKAIFFEHPSEKTSEKGDCDGLKKLCRQVSRSPAWTRALNYVGGSAERNIFAKSFSNQLRPWRDCEAHGSKYPGSPGQDLKDPKVSSKCR